MRFIDFLFWHYYSYFEQKKTVKTDCWWQAVLMITVTTSLTFGIIMATIDTFFCNLHLPSEYGQLKRVGWVIGLPWYYYLIHRYSKSKLIINGKYKLFCERWGDPRKVSKKNLKILLIYTLITTIGMLLYATIMGELNKRGLLDGYRLFP